MLIKLTKGYITVIDDHRADLAQFKWYAMCTAGGVYACRRLQNWEDRPEFVYAARPSIMLHQAVLGTSPWELGCLEIDHINGDTLDNRSVNLRLVSHEVNMQNTLRHKNRKGYSLNMRTGKFNCYLDEPGKARKYLGHVNTEAEAIAKVAAAREAHNAS